MRRLAFHGRHPRARRYRADWPVALLVFIFAIAAGVGGGSGGIPIASSFAAERATEAPRRILLIAGTVDGSHPPGTHEHVKELQALRDYLESSNIASRVSVRLITDGWPTEVEELRQADTIVLFSNGADRKEEDHPFLVGDRWEELRKAMNRGCGLILLHWSTFLPDRVADDALEWVGGYFDYQEGGAPPGWYSKIQHATTIAQPADREHPIGRGLTPFRLTDEYYYRMRFRGNDPRLKPILKVALPGESEEQVVAWAVERADGGRGFAFTGCHFLNSLELPNFRRLLLNACAWTAKVELPANGVELDDERPIRAMIVTGGQHPAHAWRETSLALEDELKRDPRMQVESVPDPEFLALPRLHDYDVIVLNYCNWNQGAGISDEAKQNFIEFLNRGGGLVIVHFTNGAFHFSLPDAGASDWPEYRTRICRRVWDHTEGKSGHDAYGPFRVNVQAEHPITAELPSFDTQDELYFRQQGNEPIEVLATAKSQVTGNDEPMAFIYDYGRGRVFQTVLGHSVESLRATGTSELLRRGTAWVAGRRPVPRAAIAMPRAALTEGRFGMALDGRRGHATADHRSEYDQWPLSVECWAQVHAKDRFQIIAAKNPKSSRLHWELYTYANSGDFSVYLPGYLPSEIRSGVNVADGQWHHVAMSCDGRRARLFVDGVLAKEEPLAKSQGSDETSPLWIGAYPLNGLGCDGLIDDVRISKVVREFATVPAGPLAADDDTVGLWSFDAVRDKEIQDGSALGNSARFALLDTTDSGAVGQTGPEDHFEGFEESQVIDHRLRDMDTGPFLASSVATPDGPTWKAIVVRIGADRSASFCFDTELLRMSAAWDGFLAFSPVRFGLIEMPKPAAAPHVATARQPGWARQGSFADPRARPPYGVLPSDWGRYLGMRLHGDRVLILYRVGDMDVAESPWLETDDQRRAFTRSIELGPSRATQQVRVGHATTAVSLQHDTSGVELTRSSDGYWIVSIAPHTATVRFRVWMAADDRLSSEQLDQWAVATPLEDLAAWRSPGPPRWSHEITVRGRRDERTGTPYVVDTIPVPFENPYRALMFTSGHDFFSNGDAAVCTVHGDVWRVSGIDDSLAQVRWKRMVAGLFQPLGLKIINDTIHVTGRDQISILRDENGDDEIDLIENLNNEGHVSSNGHEYVTNLECDADGNFYCLKGDSGGATDHDGCMLRIGPDGGKLEVFATGIRNGNGLAIGPDGIIVASPQEGTWTPASSILEVEQGGFYGMMDVHHRATAPSLPDPPLCYIPRPLDNSSGGQVWARGDWGPLSNQLLHFSFGRCRMMGVLRDHVDGQSQGAVVPLPLEFESGVMRGRFHPGDGHLYVTGLRGWVTSAAQDGCFQRVRYTGSHACLPVEWSAMANGVRLRFSFPLDSQSARDPANYSVEAWNYHWSRDYGSDEYAASDTRRKGREAWTVRSASLLDDGHTVFLEIPELRPVHQLAITYSLTDTSGQPTQSSVIATVHRLHASSIEPTGPRAGDSGVGTAEWRAGLRPGLSTSWRDAEGNESAHIARLVSIGWSVDEGTEPTGSGPIQVTSRGWLRSDQRHRVRFRFHGAGAARLTIDGLRVLDSHGETLDRFVSPLVPLAPGYHPFRIDGELIPLEEAPFRLTWSSEAFDEESIDARLLWHDPTDITEHQEQLRQSSDGRSMLIRMRCVNCHEMSDMNVSLASEEIAGPLLDGAASRFQPSWLVAWLRAPHQLRVGAAMPDLLAESASSESDAIDIAAYLLGSREARDEPPIVESGRGTEEASIGEMAREGERLFERLGCIACHRMAADDVPAIMDAVMGQSPERVSLEYVARKYRPEALRESLANPQLHFPASRMPRFELSIEELAALTAYLRRQGNRDLPSVSLGSADPERGAARFRELGCGNCHSRAGDRSTDRIRGPRLSRDGIERGCLADNPSSIGRAPRYVLSDVERSALRIGISEPTRPVVALARAEAGRRAVEYLRCSACHDLGHEQAAWPRLLSDEGSSGLVPERVPSLNWAGEKLRAAWIERLLRGEHTYRARPWLEARMPAFPYYARDLALGLAAQHGVKPTDVSNSSDNGPLTDREATLADALLSSKGLDCRQCHGLAGENLKLANEAQGIGLSFIADRLREDYFHRWLRDPLRIDPGTKMPRFTSDGRTTKVNQIADGDANAQFQILWRYVRSLQLNEARMETQLAP